MAIIHQIRKVYASKQEEMIAEILEEAGSFTEDGLLKIIEKKLGEVALIMAVLNGGEYRSQVDLDAGFAHVTRRLGRTRRSDAK